MITNIFDSHAHYDHDDFNEDRDTLLSTMNQNGISFILNSASDVHSSNAAANLADKYPFIYASAGIHPHDATTLNSHTISQIKAISQREKVVAIGEIGLDYHYDYSPRDIQLKAFEDQLILAKELNMPVIIHSREATEDTLTLLKKYKPKGVVHCFSGSAETATEIIKLGMYVGFTGVVTFKNAKHPLEAAAIVPINRLLIETDCPYMAPVPHRGKRCNSTMLITVVEILANLKKMTPQALSDQTCENALKVFEIKL